MIEVSGNLLVFKVFLFIVRAVIPIKFIDMVVVVPSMSVSVVVHVNVFSSSLTLMKPENPALRS